MIITNQKSKCCNAPLLVNLNDEGTCFYRCSKCGFPTDAVSEYKFQEIEVEPDVKVYSQNRPLPNNAYQSDYVIKLQTRVAELENEVAILRAKNI